MNRAGGDPRRGPPSVLHHSLSPLASHPPLYAASRGVRGRREGEARGGGGRRGAGKTEKCPPSPDNSEATSTPPPAAQAAAAAKPSRSLCTKAARSECRLPLAAPGAAAAAGEHGAQCRSNLPSGPRGPPLGPPPTPRGTFQTPWARGGCSGRKRWPRLEPGRRGSERGGGGAPGTVSPATRRGRARRDAGSSRSTAGVRRRRRRQRARRDRSITGSHGARAFSSLGAGASAGHTSSGSPGPAPSLPEGRRDVRWRGGCEPLSSSSSAAGWSSPRCSRGPDGRGRRRRRLLTRQRWWPDGLVQRLQPMLFKGARGGVGRCRPAGRVSAAGGQRAGRGRRWWLLVLFSGSTVSPGLSRHRERRDQRPSAGGGGANAGRSWRRRGGGDRRGGKMASAHASGRRRHKAGSSGEGGGGCSGLGCPDGNCRRLAEAPKPAVGVGNLAGERIGWARETARVGVGRGAGRARLRCVRSSSHAAVARARARGREGSVAGRSLGPVSSVRAPGGVPPPAEWIMRLFSAATASRVSVPRSPPPPPRHESGFLRAWRGPPRGPRRTWAPPRPAPPRPPRGMPPQRRELRGSPEAGRWLLTIGAALCVGRWRLPRGPLPSARRGPARRAAIAAVCG